MPLSDRPYGPTSGAASVANQTGNNVSAALAGPLPALQAITAVAETLILNPENLAVALSIAIPPDKNLEQKVLDLFASGYIKTTAAGNVTLKLYAGTVIAGGSLLGTSGAIAQATTTSPYYVKGRLIYDSVSGTLVGSVQFYVNKTLVAEATLSNFPAGISNLTAAAVAQFCLSITSSGATAGTPTTINVQAFSIG
jgi:hypothetical protein